MTELSADAPLVTRILVQAAAVPALKTTKRKTLIQKIFIIIEAANRIRRLTGFLARVPEFLAHVPESLARVPEFLAHVPESLAHVPESLAHVPEFLAHVPESLAHVPEVLAHVPEFLAHVPEFLANTPTPFEIPLEYWAESPEYNLIPSCLL
jgi:hypothetical protein